MSDDEKEPGFWRDLDIADRELLNQHMEAILVRLGQADLRCEVLRKQAAEERDLRRKKDLTDAAALATQQLEIIAGQAIELGRALATHPGFIAPGIPQEIPKVVKNSPESSYVGQQIVQDDPPMINVGSKIPRGSA